MSRTRVTTGSACTERSPPTTASPPDGSFHPLPAPWPTASTQPARLGGQPSTASPARPPLPPCGRGCWDTPGSPRAAAGRGSGGFRGSRAGRRPRSVRLSDEPEPRWGLRQPLRPERGSTPGSEVATHPGTARGQGGQGGLGSECSGLGHMGSPPTRSQGQGQRAPRTAPGYMALLPKEGRVGRRGPGRSTSWKWAPCGELPSSALRPREGRDPPKVTQQASPRPESDPCHQAPTV